MSPPRLVIAGNLLVDDLVFADGTTRMGEAGGAVLYAACSASLWSSDVACLSRCGDDYPPLALQALRNRGVDLSGVQPLGRAGGRTWLLYEGTQWRMVPRLHGPSHEGVSPSPSDVPERFRQARALHICPMPFSCQQELRAFWPDDAFISLDPHVPLREETLDSYRPLLARIDALFLGDSELELTASDGNPISVLRRLRGGRLRYVAWKRGAAGGTLYDAQSDSLISWRPRAESVVDPTGCGDSFAGSFVTAILDGEALPAALERAVTTASFTLAGWGAEALLATDEAAAKARLRSYRAM